MQRQIHASSTWTTHNIIAWQTASLLAVRALYSHVSLIHRQSHIIKLHAHSQLLISTMHHRSCRTHLWSSIFTNWHATRLAHISIATYRTSAVTCVVSTCTYTSTAVYYTYAATRHLLPRFTHVIPAHGLRHLSVAYACLLFECHHEYTHHTSVSIIELLDIVSFACLHTSTGTFQLNDVKLIPFYELLVIFIVRVRLTSFILLVQSFSLFFFFYK